MELTKIKVTNIYPRIPDSTSKNFVDSGFTVKNFPDSRIRISLHGAKYNQNIDYTILLNLINNS